MAKENGCDPGDFECIAKERKYRKVEVGFEIWLIIFLGLVLGIPIIAVFVFHADLSTFVMEAQKYLGWIIFAAIFVVVVFIYVMVEGGPTVIYVPRLGGK